MHNAFPSSFGNNAMLYANALGSVTTIMCLTGLVAIWMARELWRDRTHIHPLTALFTFRVIILLAGMAGFARSAPEVAYMLAWNEGAPETLAGILFVKRMADTMAFFPGVGWTSLLVISYPSISRSLKFTAGADGLDLFAPWPKLVRPILALVLIFTLSVLVAMGKLYWGMALR